MKELLKNLVLQNAKAIVAFIAVVVVQLFGVDIPQEVQLAVSGVLVALIVWLVPNK